NTLAYALRPRKQGKQGNGPKWFHERKTRKEQCMKHRKWILTAVILSGGLVLGVQSVSAQERPMGKQPDQAIPERVQSPPSGIQSQGMASMSAADIKKAKEALKAKGLNPGPIDGTLDSKTQQALREFQQANKLPVTGALDQ